MGRKRRIWMGKCSFLCCLSSFSSDLRSLTDIRIAIMSFLRLLVISMDKCLVSTMYQHSGNSLLRLVGLSFVQLRYCFFAVLIPLLAILELHC